MEKLNEDENGNVIVNYAYKLITGNKKPREFVPEVPVKRGRGRPRKHPMVELQEGAEAPDLSIGKKCCGHEHGNLGLSPARPHAGLH